VGLTHCLCSLESRSHHTWKVSTRAGSIVVEGSSPDSELVPLLTTPPLPSSGASPSFSLDVERRPESEPVQYSVAVTLTPMEFIYQEVSISFTHEKLDFLNLRRHSKIRFNLSRREAEEPIEEGVE